MRRRAHAGQSGWRIQPARAGVAEIARALRHHKAGRLPEAEAIYRRVLTREPGNPDALHLLGVIAHQVGRHDVAVDLIEKAIAANGAVPGFYSNLARALQAQGRLEEAVETSRRALAIAPDSVDLLNDLGVALQAQGRLEEAAETYRHALTIAPDYADALCNLGIALQAQGRLEEAVETYRRALALSPHVADIHNNLGTALRAQARLTEAVACYRRAVALAPDHGLAHINLGVALHALQRFDDAIASFRQAVALNPNDAEAHNGLGTALLAGREPIEAMECFLRAIVLRPDYAEAHNNLGLVLRAQGCLDAAVASYERACALAPALAEAHDNLGVALRDQGRLAEAAASHRRALAIKPGFAEAYSNLGSALLDLGQIDAAVESYEEALAAGLDVPELHDNLGTALRQRGEPVAAVASYRRAQALRPSPARELTIATVLPVIPASREAMLAARARFDENLDALLRSDVALRELESPLPAPAFHLAYHGLDDRDLQRKLAALYLKACPSLAWTAPHCLDGARPRAGRIRVGFVSRYFANHTIGKLTRGFIEKLSRSGFEIVVFDARGEQDDMAAVIARAADRAVRLPCHLEEARRRIAAEALDVLFYPDIGMDPLTYFLAYARLAPVQCVSWGHPVTTGIPNVDYFVSSAALEPEGADAHYSERLVRLSRLPTYYYRPTPVDQPPDRRRLGLGDDCRLYVCPQSLFKLHPDFDPIVANILRRDARGRLVLIEGLADGWRRSWHERLSRAFPDVGDRVQFVPRLGFPDFVNLLRVADVVLDPLHFGGGNSNYEAFALGVPIVTRPGRFMRGRVTYACYRQMGVADCVAESDEEYVTLAIRLASDREWRTEVVERIRARQGELVEDEAAVRELEEFFGRSGAAARVGRRLAEVGA